MRIPTPISENHRAILNIFIALALAAVSVSSPGQANLPVTTCSSIITTRDAARCIGSVRTSTPIPVLDRHHTYTLPELIDIAETASPEGRIAWATAKRSLERTGIDRALYLPILTFVAQGSDARFIVPFPEPIAPRGYVTVGEPIASAQLQFEYTLLDFGRGPKLDGSKALEIASSLRLGRIHQTLAYDTATQFYRVQSAIGELEAAKIILQTAETLLENAQSQFDNGRATLPDVENARAGAAEARYNLASAEGEVQKAKLALTETIGVEPSAEIDIVAQDNADLPGALDTSVEDLIQDCMEVTSRSSRSCGGSPPGQRCISNRPRGLSSERQSQRRRRANEHLALSGLWCTGTRQCLHLVRGSKAELGGLQCRSKT